MAETPATLSRSNSYSSIRSEIFQIFNHSTIFQKTLIKSDSLKKSLNKLDVKLTKFLNNSSSSFEKLFYSLTIFLIFITGILIGKYPKYFHIYYTGLFLLLMPIRLYTYTKKTYHYFLADLCYYVNMLLLLFIWVFPSSQNLFISVFSLALGTLSWAVVTWRNSLVLHSIEKITSSFIHIIPPVVLYVITHQLDDEYLKTRFPAVSKLTNWNFFYGIIWTSLYYSFWQIAYHYFITIKRAEKIKSGRLTSFEWLRKSNSKNRLGKFVNSLPYPWDVVCFSLIQFSYQILTMLLCPIWFNHKKMCEYFLIMIFLIASYNGATYYVDIFGKKFEKDVRKLKEEIAELESQLKLMEKAGEQDEKSVEE